MASFQSLSFIFLISKLFMFTSSSQSYDIHYNERVNVSIYYETLCSASADFVENELTDVLLDKSLFSIVNLRMVPWGNAQILEPNQTFYCQHGPKECYFNTIQACAIKSYGYSVLIYDWHNCSNSLGWDPKVIESCYRRGEGKQLELEYANETENLNPPRTYVPWVVVNNQHVKFEDLTNLAAYICNAYKCDPVPDSCRLNPSRPISTQNTNPFLPCYDLTWNQSYHEAKKTKG